MIGVQEKYIRIRNMTREKSKDSKRIKGNILNMRTPPNRRGAIEDGKVSRQLMFVNGTGGITGPRNLEWGFVSGVERWWRSWLSTYGVNASG